jgi:hypothetical protein
MHRVQHLLADRRARVAIALLAVVAALLLGMDPAEAHRHRAF